MSCTSRLTATLRTPPFYCRRCLRRRQARWRRILPNNSPVSRSPQWATPHRVALKLTTVRLRNFATSSDGQPCLLLTPFALHSSPLSDLAAGHSLVAALREAGVTNLFVT